jgi:hypothetical protein
MGKWIEAYEGAGIGSEGIPPQTIEAARSSGIVVASTSPRSMQSARRLSGGRTFLAEHVFCEAGLPYPRWHFPRLPASAWAACFRVAWFVGYRANAESITSATARAAAAAERLVRLAGENGSAFLAGHRIMTGLIAKHLIALAWAGPRHPARGYWQFSVYEK